MEAEYFVCREKKSAQLTDALIADVFSDAALEETAAAVAAVNAVMLAVTLVPTDFAQGRYR